MGGPEVGGCKGALGDSRAVGAKAGVGPGGRACEGASAGAEQSWPCTWPTSNRQWLPVPCPTLPALSLPTPTRQWLPEASWEAELSLWRRACDEGHLILTPGADCHAAEPGFFRLCFAWMPAAALPEAVHRLKRVLKEPRGAAAAPTAAAQ